MVNNPIGLCVGEKHTTPANLLKSRVAAQIISILVWPKSDLMPLSLG